MLHYYIYYRIQEPSAASLESRVRAMQNTLRSQTGIEGRLLKKRGEPLLWMEIYENVPDGESFETALANAVSEHAVCELLKPGTSRMVECFSD